VSRVRFAILLLGAAVAVHLSLVPPAQRQRQAAEGELSRLREARQRLRVRVASVEHRRLGESDAKAASGAAAVRALRQAALRATEGVALSGVEIAARASGAGPVAAEGRLKLEGRLADALRVARRLAAPSSGLLLESVSVAAVRDEVRLEARTFILREGQ